MTSQSCVVGAKLVIGQRICAALEHYDLWSEPLEDGVHDLAMVIQEIHLHF